MGTGGGGREEIFVYLSDSSICNMELVNKYSLKYQTQDYVHCTVY